MVEVTDVLFPWTTVFKWRPWDFAKYSELIKSLGSGTAEALVGRFIQGMKEDYSIWMARTIYREVRRDVERYSDIEAFKRDWVLLRTFVPLQLRLAVEQYCYGKGGQWKSISTGFRPVDVGSALLSTGGGQVPGGQNRSSKGSNKVAPKGAPEHVGRGF